MNIVQTSLQDSEIVKSKVFGDERGFFLFTLHESRYADLARISLPFVQDNYYRLSKGVLSGLHFQKIKLQNKSDLRLKFTHEI